jgi:hypothetical protein
MKSAKSYFGMPIIEPCKAAEEQKLSEKGTIRSTYDKQEKEVDDEKLS